MLLNKGERGLLIGRTGSGKTQNAIFQLKNAPIWPVIIFDTKIEDAFFSVPEGDETLDVIESLEEFDNASKAPRKTWPDFFLVRPAMHEAQDPDLLDEYSRIAYQRFGPAFIYYDELYNWHNQGRAGSWFTGLLTRGRSKGKTVLMASQRPSWVSRFCLTEAEKFYLHQLTDNRDLKTLSEVIPGLEESGPPPKYHFWHFNHGEHEKPQLYLPVPYTKPDPANKRKFGKQKWI